MLVVGGMMLCCRPCTPGVIVAGRLAHGRARPLLVVCGVQRVVVLLVVAARHLTGFSLHRGQRAALLAVPMGGWKILQYYFTSWTSRCVKDP